MKVEEVVRSWSMQKIETTLGYYNEWLASQGLPPDELEKSTVQHRIGLSDPQKCPEGHTYMDDCFEAIPPKPAIIINATTKSGRKLEESVDISTTDLNGLFRTIFVNTNDEEPSDY